MGLTTEFLAWDCPRCGRPNRDKDLTCPNCRHAKLGGSSAKLPSVTAPLPRKADGSTSEAIRGNATTAAPPAEATRKTRKGRGAAERKATITRRSEDEDSSAFIPPGSPLDQPTGRAISDALSAVAHGESPTLKAAIEELQEDVPQLAAVSVSEGDDYTLERATLAREDAEPVIEPAPLETSTEEVSPEVLTLLLELEDEASG